MFLVLQTRKHSLRDKNVSEFASREAKFYFRNNVSGGVETEKHHRKYNCFRDNVS